MPFWQAIKSCAHCRLFKRDDPSDDYGFCTWRAPKPPFWLAPPNNGIDSPVRDDDGKDCAAYEHLPDDKRPHPLDEASGYMAGVQAGDRITVRTYTVGQVSRMEARVVSYHRGFAVISLMNRSYRMRLHDSKRGRAGTIIDLPDWGLDVEAPVQRAKQAQFDMDVAVAALASIKAGDVIQLVDIINGQQHCGVKVTRVSTNRLNFVIAGRHRWMHRQAPMAGVIDGELWMLDTEHYARKTQAAT